MWNTPAGLRARRESALKSAMDSLQCCLPAAKYSLRHPQALFVGNAFLSYYVRLYDVVAGPFHPGTAGSPWLEHREEGGEGGLVDLALPTASWRQGCSSWRGWRPVYRRALKAQARPSFNGFMRGEYSNNRLNRSRRLVTQRAFASLNARCAPIPPRRLSVCSIGASRNNGR